MAASASRCARTLRGPSAVITTSHGIGIEQRPDAVDDEPVHVAILRRRFATPPWTSCCRVMTVSETVSVRQLRTNSEMRLAAGACTEKRSTTSSAWHRL